MLTTKRISGLYKIVIGDKLIFSLSRIYFKFWNKKKNEVLIIVNADTSAVGDSLSLVKNLVQHEERTGRGSGFSTNQPRIISDMKSIKALI